MTDISEKTDIWTLKYRPETLDGILGNETPKKTLRTLIESKTLPHMVFYGPSGSGKTTAVLALARELFGESCDLNLTYLNASDFFDLGKQYIAKDKRFYRLLGTDDPTKIQKSVLNIFKEIINEYAALAPMDHPFKIIFIDSAESLLPEAQQALRRTMEKYSSTCRFIFSSTQISGLIPPLRSRCISLFFNYVSHETLCDYLSDIAGKENIRIDQNDLETVVEATNGNVSRSLEILQLSAEAGKLQMVSHFHKPEPEVHVTSEHYLPEVLNVDPAISDLMSTVKTDRDFLKARTVLDTLLFDMGLTGSEIIEKIWLWVQSSVFSEKKAADMMQVIALHDRLLSESSSERIVLESLVAHMLCDCCPPSE